MAKANEWGDPSNRHQTFTPKMHRSIFQFAMAIFNNLRSVHTTEVKEKRTQKTPRKYFKIYLFTILSPHPSPNYDALFSLPFTGSLTPRKKSFCTAKLRYIGQMWLSYSKQQHRQYYAGFFSSF